MRRSSLLLTILSFCCTAFGQFQLKVPGGHLESIARVEDTLYFWGENRIWRSTDWGETIHEWDAFNTDPFYGYTPCYHCSGSTHEGYSLSRTNNTFIKHDQILSPTGHSRWEIYNPKFRKFHERTIPFHSRVKTDGFSDFNLCVTNTYRPSYTFSFMDEQGNDRNYTVQRYPPYHQDSIITYKTYCNEHIIGYLQDQIRILSLSDSIVFSIVPSATINFNQAEFWNINKDQIGIFEKNTQFALMNIPDMSIVIKPYPVQFLSKYHHQNEILFSDSITLSSYNISDGIVRQVQNLPADWQSSDLYYLGSKYLCFYDRASGLINYTTNLGQTWSTKPDIGIYSNHFNFMFDYQDSIYAIREGKIYTTSCSKNTELMKYRNDISQINESIFCKPYLSNGTEKCSSGPIDYFNNFDSVLVYNNLISNDFGLSWSELLYKKLYLDFKHQTIYGLDSIKSGRVFRTRDLGASWDTIQNYLPASPAILSGFLAKGDTILFNNYLSIDDGKTWDIFITNSVTYIYPYSYILQEITDLHVVIIPINANAHNGYQLDFDGNVIRDVNYNDRYLGEYARFKNNYYFVNYHNEGHFGNKHSAIISLDGRYKPAFFRPLPTSIDKCSNFGWNRFGISDHYLYEETFIYPLARNVIDTSSCKAQLDFRGVTYQSGQDYILSSGSICTIDTLLSIKKLPLEAKTIEVTLCSGDTLWVDGNAIVSSIYPFVTNQYITDTIPGQGLDCDTSVIYHVKGYPTVISNPKIYACQNQTIQYLGNAYTSDTSIFSPNLVDTTCNSQYKTLIDFLPTTLSDTMRLHLCATDSVLLFGKYHVPPFTLDTITLVSALNQSKCHQQIVICTENFPANDTLYSTQFMACADSIFTFSGQNYTPPAFIPTVSNVNTLCGGNFFTPLIAIPNTIDTLPITTFCASTGITWNGVFYTETTFVSFPDPSTPCSYIVKPLIQLPCFVANGNALEMVAPPNNSFIPNTFDKAENYSIMLLPNPASDFVTIQSALPGRLTLQDQLGRIVFVQPVNVGQVNFSVTGLPAGIYSWHIMTTRGVYEGRLVVVKN
jgi:hypothetical protein